MIAVCPLNIVWFKRDLRLVDHRPLIHALRAGPILPLYIAEPELWAQPDASARQWAFAAESLARLQEDLAALGQPLCVMTGDAVAIFADLHRRFGIAALWSHEETGNGWTYARDRAVKAWARGAGVLWHETRQFGVIRRIASRQGWAAAWDRAMAEPITPAPAAVPPLTGDWPTHIPDSAALGLAPDPCPARQPGGRMAALATLESFLHQRGRDYRYRMSSPLSAFDASSRLSPHLTWGTIAMREVAQASQTRLREVRAGNEDHGQSWRASLISFAGRLHWHCHFMQKLEDEPQIEFGNFHPAYDGLRPDTADLRRLAAWSEGMTGFPFVDACMRALDIHGWINFRMRAMLMSFASYHLWLPWRDTGLHLARKFVDYEPGIHWPQVQMQSGTTGINTLRIYNPVKQGYDHDPAGQFVRRFVPELAALPDAFIHEPWRWEGAAGLPYPRPIVDQAGAAKAARDALYALRKAAGHKATAGRIAERHGSRKAGIPMTGAKRGVKRRPSANTQLLLDL
ncbi:MAG: deoxyribodipyrimidine photo-lyase [Sphingomonadales bacterium]|nr:deoxyribodipyrimidine photo-lyase [Sphingomonadales bacterium]MDE2170309.1 deoxyribodipyrimidine photo-lyase [Sphingomonadales bacterium]